MCLTESICDIKNTNMQIYCCQKIHVIKISYLLQVSWLLSSLQKKIIYYESYLIKYKKESYNYCKEQILNRKMKNIIYIHIFIYYYASTTVFTDIFTSRYSWNTAKIIKHKSINQSTNTDILLVGSNCEGSDPFNRWKYSCFQYLKSYISNLCSSLQLGMARIYARCVITESIYCDIKNTNLQIYCCQKIHVIKISYLPQVSWLLFSLQKIIYYESYLIKYKKQSKNYNKEQIFKQENEKCYVYIYYWINILRY